jgi:hypothetical protein
MAIKYNQNTLDKIVKVLNEAGYVLRFEKGSFNSGYCILEHKKVVVVNKFLDVEGRINILADILGVLQMDPDHLSAEAKKTLQLFRKESLIIPEPGEQAPEEPPAQAGNDEPRN